MAMQSVGHLLFLSFVGCGQGKDRRDDVIVGGDGLQNGESIDSVTMASLGAAASANVAGSPYLITTADAVGSNGFDATNYSITHENT